MTSVERRTFHLVTLGCPKNRVDTEGIWAQAALKGLAAVDDPAAADVIIVNTCAFIRSAVQESLETVIDLARFKRSGRCSLLVVAGCLPGRYGKELLEQLPEVDLFVGSGEVAELSKWLTRGKRKERLHCEPARGFLPQASTPRVNSLSRGAAYLKIAEGCSRSCSFCVIPRIRGPHCSRSLDDLVAEAEGLTRLGVKELILVAQDLSSWGHDLPGKPPLSDLVEALSGVAGLYWLRLMYLFPLELPARLLRVMARNKTVLPYLDLPLQHADREVLRGMRRRGDPETYMRMIERIRTAVPAVVIRTSLMTGFPGESEAAFQRLLRFVERCRFERLGVFCFSPEEGTDAAALPERPLAKLAKKRRAEILSLQRKIALGYHRSLVGTTLEVLVEREGADGTLVGRAWNQAPEVDGSTVLAGRAEPGEIVRARLIAATPYDLEGTVIS